MNDSAPSNVATPVIWQRGRILHLFALCSFAFTEPLLTILKTQSVYIQDQQVGWAEISVVFAALLIGVPLLAMAADFVCYQLSRALRGYGRNLVIGLLFALIFLTITRKFAGNSWFVNNGLSGIVSLTAATTGALICTYLYQKAAWFRMWLSFGAIGLILFPLSFIWQFHQLTKPKLIEARHLPIENPVPVIMVVLDEFSCVSLSDGKNGIDAAKFPNFARLANLSTWYRNATSVHPLTPMAVPAILSGRYPVTDLDPVENFYPGNLFELIHQTDAFDMAVFEPITRLCPESLIPEGPALLAKRNSISFFSKTRSLIEILASVYPQLIFTKDIPIPFPEVPLTWTGFIPRATVHAEDFIQKTEGLFNYTANRLRDQQLEHFLKCIKPSEKPRFCFMHAVIPHFPWCFLPTGERYLNEASAPINPIWKAGSTGESSQDDLAIGFRNEYRYRLQLGYVDRFIGRLLDRLEETELLDKCLLIVTADHGICFQPGLSLRLPEPGNFGDILSIPMFVKRPEQRTSAIDDRNVSSVDLLPTLAELLKFELPEPVDGTSILNEQRPPRKTFYYEQTMTVTKPDLPHQKPSTDRNYKRFGARPLTQPPAEIATHADWHGQRIDQFTVDPNPVTVILEDPLQFEVEGGTQMPSTFIRNFVIGKLKTSDLKSPSADMLVAVDGTIRDSGRTYWVNRHQQAFEFLIPGEPIPYGKQKIELYLVEQNDGKTSIRPTVFVKPETEQLRMRR